MDWWDFVETYGMKEIERDPEGGWRGWMMEMCPYEGHDEDEVRFYVNERLTVFMAVDEVRGMVRVAYWEMGMAITEWNKMEHLRVYGCDAERSATGAGRA